MIKIYISLTLILSSTLSFAQNKSFTLDIQNDTILAGNYIVAKFSVVNIDGDFEAPSLKGFDIISGPNTSSLFSMVNGETTRQSSYTYYLRPTKEGDIYIAPAYLYSDTDTLETEPISIYVLPNPEGVIVEPEQPSNNNFNFTFPENNFDLYPNDRQPLKIKKKKTKLKTRKL